MKNKIIECHVIESNKTNDERCVKIAIVGEEQSGKSSFMRRLSGQETDGSYYKTVFCVERKIVHDNQNVMLIDVPGCLCKDNMDINKYIPNDVDAILILSCDYKKMFKIYKLIRTSVPIILCFNKRDEGWPEDWSQEFRSLDKSCILSLCNEKKKVKPGRKKKKPLITLQSIDINNDVSMNQIESVDSKDISKCLSLESTSIGNNTHVNNVLSKILQCIREYKLSSSTLTLSSF